MAPGASETGYALDVRLVPTATGTARFSGIDVTYRAGHLRERTARLGGGVCLEVYADDWRAHVNERSTPCRRVA